MWPRERERYPTQNTENAQQPDGDARLIRTPIRIGKIMAALEREATKGSAQAARELRAWLEEYPPQDEDMTKPEDLPKVMRDRLANRLIAEIEEEDAAEAARIKERMRPYYVSPSRWRQPFTDRALDVFSAWRSLPLRSSKPARIRATWVASDLLET